MVLAGEIPVAHRYFSDVPASKRLDLVPVLELCRQGCYVLGHGYYGAPDGARFILRELTGRLQPDAPAVPKVRVEVTVAKAFQRDGRTTGLALDYKVTTLDGEDCDREILTVLDERGDLERDPRRGQDQTRPRRNDRRTRPDRSLPRAARRRRSTETNVLLADPVFDQGVMTATAGPDPGNQAMFEHPQDHIPGMVLIEAARQAALWTLSRHLGVPASSFHGDRNRHRLPPDRGARRGHPVQRDRHVQPERPEHREGHLHPGRSRDRRGHHRGHTEGTVMTLGGKGDNLQRLTTGGLTVPKWAAVGLDVLRDFRTATGLDREIAGLLAGLTKDTAEEISAQIAKAFAATPLDAASLAAIDVAYAAAGGERWPYGPPGPTRTCRTCRSPGSTSRT